MVLYDPITKKQHVGGWGTTSNGGRGTKYISTNKATHGRELVIQNPLTPKGFGVLNPSRSFSQQSTAFASLVGNVSGAVDASINKLYPYYATTSIGDLSGRTSVPLYKPEVAKRLQQDKLSLDLAKRTAETFSTDLWKKYEGVFFANQIGGIESSFKKFDTELQKNIDVFRSTYNTRDDRFLKEAIEKTRSSLVIRAQQGTPRKKSKLFGFLPIKVSAPVQSSVIAGISLGIAAYTAPASSVAVASSGVGGTGVGTVGTVAPSFSVGVAGANVAPFSQFGNFAVVPGIQVTASGLAPVSAGLTWAPVAGSAVSTPVFASTSVQAAQLGITPASLGLPVASPQPSIFDNVTQAVKNEFDEVLNYVKGNPVKSVVGATSGALTLKKVAESSNPLAALVNTVAGAVGLPPLINPGGSTSTSPFASYGSYGGGGGGGGNTSQSTIGSTGVLWVLAIGFAILLILKLRK